MRTHHIVRTRLASAIKASPHPAPHVQDWRVLMRLDLALWLWAQPCKINISKIAIVCTIVFRRWLGSNFLFASVLSVILALLLLRDDLVGPGNVEGSVVVGVQFDSALGADELRLALALSVLVVSALRTGLTGVVWIDPYDLDAKPLGLVVDVLLKVEVGPVPQNECLLFFSAEPFEHFHLDRTDPVLDGEVYDGLADEVVVRSGEGLLLLLDSVETLELARPAVSTLCRLEASL